MRWLAAPLLIAGGLCLAQAAPFGTSPPKPAGSVASTLFSTTASPADAARSTSITQVMKWNCTSPGPTTCTFNTPSGLATQVVVSLFSATGSRSLANTCIGVGGGTKAWDFGAAPTRIKCGGSNGCTIPASGGKVLDATTFTVSTSQPLIISTDYAAASYNNPRYVVVVSPANTSPAATNTANYNTYFLTGVQQACTKTKNASYTNVVGNLFEVSSIVAQ